MTMTHRPAVTFWPLSPVAPKYAVPDSAMPNTMPTWPKVVRVPDAAPASVVGISARVIEVCGMISTIIPTPARTKGGRRLQPLRVVPVCSRVIMTQTKAAACMIPPRHTDHLPIFFIRSMATGVPRIDPMAIGSRVSPAAKEVK